jgi:hypothetical protein
MVPIDVTIKKEKKIIMCMHDDLKCLIKFIPKTFFVISILIIILIYFKIS